MVQAANKVIKMNVKTKFKLGTLGAFLGYTAATCGVGYEVGRREGYRAADFIEETCYEMIDSIRKEFERGCGKKTVYTLYNGSLNPILQKRDEITEKYQCPEESWMCEPTRPYDLDRSDFKAVYSK